MGQFCHSLTYSVIDSSHNSDTIALVIWSRKQVWSIKPTAIHCKGQAKKKGLSKNAQRNGYHRAKKGLAVLQPKWFGGITTTNNAPAEQDK